MKSRFPKILFFIEGSIATATEKAKVLSYGPGCCFRNALFISENEALEQCDGVAGKVPERYSKCIPAEEALQNWTKSISFDNSAKTKNKANVWKPNA